MSKIGIGVVSLITLVASIALTLISSSLCGNEQSTEKASVQYTEPTLSPYQGKEDPCQYYNIDSEFRNKLNGHKLDLNYEPRFESDYAESNITLLSTGQMLVGIGEALYMLNQDLQVAWKYEVPQMLFDYAIIESTGLIYVTAGDNNMFILEASTGKQLYRDFRNGRAGYGEVVPYKENQCLILDNFSGYRYDWNKLREMPSIISSWKDGITAWQGTEVLWHRDFPPDAELMIKGDKIYAMTKTRMNIYVSEISVPKTKKK
jgi:hypothetical protein